MTGKFFMIVYHNIKQYSADNNNQPNAIFVQYFILYS